MSLRTDMAYETLQHTGNRSIAGLKKAVKIDENSCMEITDISVSGEAAEVLGKKEGRYITLRSLSGGFDEYSEYAEQRGNLLGRMLNELCGNPKKLLVVGLGNRNITPDAVGPLAADKIFATRHIKRLAQEIDSSGLGEVTVISTGVLGKTGIEASEQVKAVCSIVKPDVVVACDALACSEIENLGSTVQLCDTGISPGSGVENARKELSLETLGVPCIAVGVPTVTDMSTVAESVFFEEAPENSLNMILTPKNCDKLVSNCAQLLSHGINAAFHKGISPDEARILAE